MKRSVFALCVLVGFIGCNRKPREFHYVQVVEAGPALTVTGMFGVTGAAPASGSGAWPSRGCVRVSTAQRGTFDPDAYASAARAAQRGFRAAGELVLRDGAGATLGSLRPVLYGLYAGAVPHQGARRLSVEVTGGDGVPAHRFDSVPLNPDGNPTRFTAPAQGFVARRRSPLTLRWAGAGFRDALLSVALGDAGAGAVIACRVDFGAGAITLPGSSMDLPGEAGEVAVMATLLTMTSTVEGVWQLSVMSTPAVVAGALR
jgi:hypothetical protein